MKYIVKQTKAFRKDYKRAKKRGLDLTKLQKVVDMIANGKPLPETLRDHPLTNNWAHHRECHIAAGRVKNARASLAAIREKYHV